jgi:hypothetical protein
MLRSYQPFDILLLNWLLIGNKDMIKGNRDSLLNTYDMCNDEFSNTGKSVAKFSSIAKTKVNPYLFEYFSVHPSQLIIKNVLNQTVANSIPIEFTEIISKTMNIRKSGQTLKNNQKQLEPKTQEIKELKGCLPCIFNYSKQTDSQIKNRLLFEQY